MQDDCLKEDAGSRRIVLQVKVWTQEACKFGRDLFNSITFSSTLFAFHSWAGRALTGG